MTVIELQKLKELLADPQLPPDSFVINEQPGFFEVWCHPNPAATTLTKRLMGAKHIATIYLGNETIEVHRPKAAPMVLGKP